MGFPMFAGGSLGRAALIGAMLMGGLLSAGISQAQDVGDQDIRAERQAELIAASGGPASDAHLIAFARDQAAVEVRDDDVAPAEDAATPATPVSTSVGTSGQQSRIARADATAAPAERP